jgi:hypothetical protein
VGPEEWSTLHLSAPHDAQVLPTNRLPFLPSTQLQNRTSPSFRADWKKTKEMTQETGEKNEGPSTMPAGRRLASSAKRQRNGPAPPGQRWARSVSEKRTRTSGTKGKKREREKTGAPSSSRAGKRTQLSRHVIPLAAVGPASSPFGLLFFSKFSLLFYFPRRGEVDRGQQKSALFSNPVYHSVLHHFSRSLISSWRNGKTLSSTR